MLKFFIGLALKFLSSHGYKVLTVEEHDDLLYSKGIADSTKKFLGEFSSLMFVLSFTNNSKDAHNDATTRLKDLLDRSFLDLERECYNVENSEASSQIKIGRQKGYSLVKDLKECFDFTLSFHMNLVLELKKFNRDLHTSLGRVRQRKEEMQKKLDRINSSSKAKQKQTKRQPKYPASIEHENGD